jgi:hypothetical protein
VNVLGSLEPDVLKALLRRLTVTACLLGAGGVVVALALAQPWVAVGIALGVAGGFVNLRLVDRQISRVDVDADETTKVLRRKVGSRSVARLAAITVVVLGVVVIYAPLGIGIVVGLVLFQLAFVLNVIRAMYAQGGPA